MFPRDRKSYTSYVCMCAQSCLTLRSHGLQAARLLCPWNFPGKNTGVGYHFSLQVIFPTQGLNPHLLHRLHWQVGSLPLINAGGTEDTGSIPGPGGSPRGGKGNTLQYSCLENSMDREVWWTTAHGVTQLDMVEHASLFFF